MLMSSPTSKIRQLILVPAACAAIFLLAGCDILDGGGMSAVQPPNEPSYTPSPAPTATETSIPAPDETNRPPADGPTSILPGLSGWEESRSGDYIHHSAHTDDGKNDGHVCVLGDISINGMDLTQVGATVEKDPNGDLPWHAFLNIVMMPPANATPDQFLQWAIEVQNNLGLLIIYSEYGELDDSGFESETPEILRWMGDGGEVGIDLRLTASFATADQAVQALAPYFENLSVTVKTEAPEGQVCDEFPG